MVLPGGFGTLDELFEALTLVQTRKVTSFPVVLIGTEYWSGLLDWLRGTVLAEGKIARGDFDMLAVTDDVEEAVAMMVEGVADPVTWFFAVLIVLVIGAVAVVACRARGRPSVRRTTTGRTCAPRRPARHRGRPACPAVQHGRCGATGPARWTRSSSGWRPSSTSDGPQ